MATRILEQPKEPGALALLLIRNGLRAGTPLTLKHGVTRIGRSGLRNDHVIEDEAVSEEHLVIRYEGGKFILNDLGSTNHTRVNGEDVARHALEDRDVIRIGETELVFLRFDPEIRSTEMRR